MRKIFTGISWCTQVASSWQVITRLPSPARQTTCSSGQATLAPIVADDRNVSGDVLGDLRRVDVDVDELGPRRELRELAGDPVVEAGGDCDDQVRLVHCVVGGPRAVHAK